MPLIMDILTDKYTAIILSIHDAQIAYKHIITNIISHEKLDKIIVIHCFEKTYKPMDDPKIMQLKYWDEYAKYGCIVKYKVALEPYIKTEAILFVDDSVTIQKSTCLALFSSWQHDKTLVHGNHTLSIAFNFNKNKYIINKVDNEPHIILSTLCIVAQKYIREAYEYVLDIQDIFEDCDPTYAGIDICLSILTACKQNTHNRINKIVDNVKCKEVVKVKPIDWTKNVYSDICTIAVKKWFDNKTIDTTIKQNFPEVLVILPFFNFAGFNQLYTNIHDAVFSFNNQNINIVVMEAVPKGNISQLYTLPCKILTTETDTIAFHKEGLFNKGFNLYQKLYEMFVLCDSDIIFADEMWAEKLIKLYKSGVEVVQPFSVCHWTDKAGEIAQSGKSYSFIRAENERIGIWDHKKSKNLRMTYHPGFVWAFAKSFLLRTNGIYSKCFTGSGDEMVIFLVEGRTIENNNFYKYLQPDLNNFLLKGGGKHDAMKGVIYHLYHGNTVNRKYVERHSNILKARINLGPEFFSEELDNFLLKAIHPKVNEINLAYFKGRREDD